MISIPFTKMHALGNDFVVVNAINQTAEINQLWISTSFVSSLANRYTGIGFDQLLIISKSNTADFFCRIFNADGSEAEQCGNGLRCVARLLHENKLTNHSSFRIETKAGIYPIEIHNYDHISVAMGAPHIQETLLPLSLSANLTVPVTIVSVGNPHAIVKVSSIETVLADKLAKAIAAHSKFSNGANVGFMQIVDAHHIRLRTIERGSGETLACGSNACAAAIAGMINGWLQRKVNVAFKYGSLIIEWDKNILHMTGPATRVFSGVLSSAS